MSLGTGHLQNKILQYVREQRTPLTSESLRWGLYEWVGKPALAVGDTLPAKWNSSVARAIKGLVEERQKLRCEKRLLATLDEWVEHYPNKPHRVDIRDLRLALLPSLKAWMESSTAPRLRYTTAKNELFYLEKELPEDRQRELREKWHVLESKLRSVYTTAPSNELFLLLAKGKAFFEDLPISSQTSFHSVVEKVSAKKLLPADVVDQLFAFTLDFMPLQTTGALKLKSVVHQLAWVQQRGALKLKPETLQELYAREKSYLEKMPGFVAGKRGSLRLTNFGTFGGHQFSPLLKRLLDHTVFHEFHFLTLTEQPAASPPEDAATVSRPA